MPPKFIGWNPNVPMWWYWGGRAFGKWLGTEGRALMNGISTLIEEDQSSSLCQSWLILSSSRWSLCNVSDVTATANDSNCPRMLQEIIDVGMYLPDSFENIRRNETGLYWKRMSSWSYISKESLIQPMDQGDIVTFKRNVYLSAFISSSRGKWWI